MLLPPDWIIRSHGFRLGNRIPWQKKPHIAYITNKIAKSIGILTKTRKYLNPKTIHSLYYTFVYPLLLYGNCIWGNAPNSTLWPIFRLQKMAVRLIVSIKKRDSTNIHFYKLKIIKLPDLFFFNVAIFMFKYNKNKLPEIFDDFFIRSNEIHNRVTRQANLLRIPMVKNDGSEHFIKKQGVLIWQELSDVLDTGVSLAIFKKQVQGYIIAKYGSEDC